MGTSPHLQIRELSCWVDRLAKRPFVPYLYSSGTHQLAPLPLQICLLAFIAKHHHVPQCLPSTWPTLVVPSSSTCYCLLHITDSRYMCQSNTSRHDCRGMIPGNLALFITYQPSDNASHNCSTRRDNVSAMSIQKCLPRCLQDLFQNI